MPSDLMRISCLLAGLLLLAALVCAAPVASSTPAQVHQADSTQRQFDHLLPEHGLSSATVYSILQDRTGFLWLGTEGGLNRYDGYSFEVFRHDPTDPGSVASDDISFLLEDSEGILWLATWGSGLDRFDPVTESFQHFRSGTGRSGTGRSEDQGAPDEASGDGLQDDRVQHVLEDSRGELWVGTFSGGLSRFDRATGVFETYRSSPQDPTSLCDDRVWRIEEDSAGDLWLGTGKGLCRFDRQAGTFERFRHVAEDPSSLSDDVVRTLAFDRSGALWVGTAGGLDRFDREAGTFERFLAGPEALSHDVITAIYEDSRERLWIGTRGGGLNLFDRTSGKWSRWRHDPTDPASLSDDDVRTIFEDRTGVLWVTTRQGGLNKLDLEPAKFERSHDLEGPRSLGSDRVRGFAEDTSGRLAVATAEGVVLEAASGSYDHLRSGDGTVGILPSSDVHAVIVDRRGALWVAAGRSGLHRLPEAGTALVTYRHDPEDPRSLVDDQVTALVEDRTGVLWVGTVSGLDRLDPSGEPVFEHYLHQGDDAASLSEDFVTALYVDRGGSVWVGTHSGGLNRLDPATGGFERFRHDPRDPASLSNDRILTLHEQENGSLWVGTANGLNEVLPGGKFHRTLEAHGLPHPQVAGILGDGQGFLWLATGHGLARFDPRTGSLRAYTQRDGLQAGPFNPGSSLARRDGRLCFGGNNGYNCFDPEAVIDDPQAPPVVLTAFERLGEEAELGRAPWAVESVHLSHEDTFFAFEFAALDFTDPRENRYRYMLEGFDRDWIDAGGRRSASYTRVAPGRYVFRVRGAGSDAVWNDAGLDLAVSIAPPFWGTWWFRSAIVLALLSAGGGAYRLRIGQLQRRERRLAQRVAEGLADLRQSEERYRLLFERNLAGVVRLTPDGRILDCNEAFARILGYDTPRECRERHLLNLDSSPEVGPSLLAMLRRDGMVVSHEGTAYARDGSMVSLLWNASLLAGEDDEPEVVEGTVIDVSERRRIEEGLRRAQKLESLGVLAGGIAHDFNNLLMAILGNTELAAMKLEPDSPVRPRLEQIEIASQRAAELSRQMLAYSGKGEFVITRFDLSRAIRGMAHLLEGAVSKKASLVYELADELPRIEADAGQVEQVVMSLLTNAAEALGGASGTIRVATGSRDLRAEELADTYFDDRLPAGRYVFLSVGDDGCGMDESLQLKIFDPFFTTKFTGRGLGLAAVLGIVRGHRGAIQIDSVPGRGSVFTVLFPAAPERRGRVVDAVQKAASESVGDGSGRGIVLVVDDDESVRLVAQDMVEALGFDVLMAADGREAVEVFSRRRDDVDLVLLDLAMPRMSGEEAFREIREIAPEARVILASGYDERESTRLFAGKGLSGFIQKPYRLAALKEEIRVALGDE
ncbi:MAG: response regulator [bacterium]|nr:response regulator [bacterium]